MNQSAQCLNCETIFETPGVAIGKTAIVLCPRCKKAVVVKGQVDPQDAAPTGPIPTAPVRAVPDRTGPIPRPVADRTGPIPRPVADPTGPIPRPVPDHTGPVSIPGLDRNVSVPTAVLDRLDRTGPIHTGPIATGPIEKGKVKEEDSHAWKTRPVSERPIVDREKKLEEPAPKPPVAVDGAATWKLAAMGLFTLACVAFTLVRVFYHPAPDPQTQARIEANENAFVGVVPVEENGVSIAVITDAYARALAGAPERDICTNAIFQGVMAMEIRTETGKHVADCSALVRRRP
jgi:hypothetical protein